MRHFPGSSPARGPPTPQKLDSDVSAFLCSFEFSRDRHCHGDHVTVHIDSSNELLRVAVRIPVANQLLRLTIDKALRERVHIMATL